MNTIVRIICYSALLIVASTEVEQCNKPKGLTSRIKGHLKNGFSHVYKSVTKVVRDEPVPPNQVSFFLYSKDKYNVTLDPNDLSEFSHKTAQVVFLIHGWRSSREKPWYGKVRNIFLSKKYHVVEVDWKEPARKSYPVSSLNAYDVAKIIEKLIENLVELQLIPLENILLVGHSLGGQICGLIGKTLQENLGKKLPRIIALDPAGPLFTQVPCEERLNKNDASYVEVVHTDGGSFGFKGSCGTIDFYVNGGKNQPGCPRVDLPDIRTIKSAAKCDHRRAYEYFAEALLDPKKFVGKKCQSWDNFTDNSCGIEEAAIGNLTIVEEGKFFLRTNQEQPYATELTGGVFNRS